MRTSVFPLIFALALSACVNSPEASQGASPETRSAPASGGSPQTELPSSSVDSVASDSSSAPAEPAELDGDSAFAMCYSAIKDYSLHAASAVVPDVRAEDLNQSEFYFRWSGDHKLQLQNQFGAMIDVEGACIVSVKKKQIEVLVVGDKYVVDTINLEKAAANWKQ